MSVHFGAFASIFSKLQATFYSILIEFELQTIGQKGGKVVRPGRHISFVYYESTHAYNMMSGTNQLFFFVIYFPEAEPFVSEECMMALEGDEGASPAGHFRIRTLVRTPASAPSTMRVRTPIT